MNYGEILDAAKAAEKTADYCVDYEEEIGRKITRKLENLERGGSGYTGAAKQYAEKKIKQLETKKEKYQKYGQALEDFVSEAKRTDKQAAAIIKGSYQMYIKDHNIQVNPMVEGLAAIAVWGGNASGFGQVLEAVYDFDQKIRKDILEGLEYWYRCEGGKNVVKIAVAAAGVVLAVAGIIVAWPLAVTALTAGLTWSSVVAVAGLVTSAFAVVNSLTDIAMEFSALSQNRENPAKALMASKIDDFSGWLRQKIFTGGQSWMNGVSMKLADGLDAVEFVCGVIGFADVARNGIKFAKKLKLNSVKGVWSEFKVFYKNSDKKTPWGKVGGYINSKMENQTIYKSSDKKTLWGKIGGYINSKTENQTIKYMGQRFEQSAKNGSPLVILKKQKKWVPGPKLYSFAQKINDSKILKYTKKTIEYTDIYLDACYKDGIGEAGKNILKEGTKDILKSVDLIDKGWEVAEKAAG